MGRTTSAMSRRGVVKGGRRRRWVLKHSLAIVLISLSAIVVSFTISASIENSLRSPLDFYVLPRTADDWSAWGTAMGALGTSGALIYAAMKFRSDAKEQRDLRLDRDAKAREDARPLWVDLSLTYPTEDLGPEVSGLTLTLTNWGKKPFNNIRVKIPDVPAKIVSARSAPIPPLLVDDDPAFGREATVWNAAARPQEMVGGYWLCGDVPPDAKMALEIDFDESQHRVVWEESTLSRDTGRGEREGRVAVIYEDFMGRTWVRSTEGRQPLQRIWPDDFIY